MDFIVVYDRKARDNPIVAIHVRQVWSGPVDLKDIHPEDDPAERGVVMVPGEIVGRMVVHEYRRDAEGRVVDKPVLHERTKDLSSIPDSALGQNLLVFGEPLAELVSITDLKGQRVGETLVIGERGVIGIGQHAGFFSVVGRVDTGVRQPEVLSERQNWRWTRDKDGNIVGMELIDSTAGEAPPS